MSKKKKRVRNRRGMQAVTLCISTTMVLVLLGMVVFFVLSARHLSAHMKENLTVTVMLKDSVTVNDAHLLCRDLYHRPYSHNIDYISKEQAQKEQIKELGSDPTEFLGFNPFPATLEIQLASDYANTDSLKWIVEETGDWAECCSTEADGNKPTVPILTEVRWEPEEPVVIAPGQVLYLKWKIDPPASGSAAMMGIDDVSVVFARLQTRGFAIRLADTSSHP